tara:strand:- start:1800 stop:2312 length:513 start_codon:yes stop_codon:yes gene_type:complete
MNIFKQLNKLPQTGINEVSYGNERVLSNSFHDQRSFYKKVFEGKTYLEWAEHYGISYTAVRDRIKKEGTVHPKGYQGRYNPRTTFQGKPANWWGKKLGVTGECIRYRMLKHGKPFATVERNKYQTEYEGKSNKEWATELGCSINAIQKRMKKNGNPFINGKLLILDKDDK